MLQIASLNSGSNGNCYYIGNSSEAVLVDAGISCREIEKRMKGLGLAIEKVKAIFISHEHSDHIRGVEVLSKKYKLPVYVNDATRTSGRLMLDLSLIQTFDDKQSIDIHELSIIPFQKKHDAADPYSFTISFNGINIGVYTDIGQPCAALKEYFNTCDAAFLEANYDEEMLATGNYPYHLKERISGGLGHLSNREAYDVFQQHRSDKLSLLLLSHLSANNNCPTKVQELFTQNAGHTKIVVLSRHQASAVFEVYAKSQQHSIVQPAGTKQMSLF